MPEATRAQVEILYNRYGAMVHGRCLRILGNKQDALDATQEVFARVMRHHDSFRAESSPSTWIMRISTNHCLNVLRNRRGRREKLQAHKHDLPQSHPGERVFDGVERAQLVRLLLSRFDPDIQRLAIHFYIDGMSKTEIAQLCELSVPTVRKRLDIFIKRSRRMLRRELVAALPRELDKEVNP